MTHPGQLPPPPPTFAAPAVARGTWRDGMSPQGEILEIELEALKSSALEDILWL